VPDGKCVGPGDGGVKERRAALGRAVLRDRHRAEDGAISATLTNITG
jgi:hypothetical protein